MLFSAVLLCSTRAFCAETPVAQPAQSAAPKSQQQTAVPMNPGQKNTQPSQAASAPAATPGPDVRTVNRPQTEPPKPKTEEKPAEKAKQGLDLLPVEQSIVDYTNAERSRFGLQPMAVDANLMATARQHCAWMTNYRQLVHTRIGVAENIAMGQPNSQDVVRCWMNSSGHRANILNGGHRRIGVAAYRTPEGTIFWCQQFAP